MSSKLKAADLIQFANGIELPAPGSWIISAGQPMVATRPWALRPSDLEIVGGSIDVDTGQLTMSLHLEVQGTDRPSFRFGYTGQLIDADRYGRWSFDGPATIGKHHLPNLRLAVTYLGVYDHGAAPVALLQVHAQYRRQRPARHIGGQINAQRSTSFADAEQRRSVDSRSSNRHRDHRPLSVQVGQAERGRAGPEIVGRCDLDSEDEVSHV